MNCHGRVWRRKWRARIFVRSTGTGQSKERKQEVKKEARIEKGDRVTHASLGQGLVVGEWGLFFACRDCYKELDGPRRQCRCGGVPLAVYGGGIVDVLCHDGKTRSINKQWLRPVGL